MYCAEKGRLALAPGTPIPAVTNIKLHIWSYVQTHCKEVHMYIDKLDCERHRTAGGFIGTIGARCAFVVR